MFRGLLTLLFFVFADDGTALWKEMGHTRCAPDDWRDGFGNKLCHEWHPTGCILEHANINDVLIAQTWKDGFHIGHCKQCNCVGHCTNAHDVLKPNIDCDG